MGLVINHHLAVSILRYIHDCNQKFHNTHTVMYSTNKKKFMGQVTTKERYSLWLNLL